MHIHYFCAKQKIRSRQHEANNIKRHQQIIIRIQISAHFYVFGHQTVEMTTIPTYYPLTEHKHQQSGNKHGYEKQKTIVVFIDIFGVEKQTIKQEKSRHIQNTFRTFMP